MQDTRPPFTLARLGGRAAFRIPNSDFRIGRAGGRLASLRYNHYVPVSTRLLHTMVEIWARKDEPESADLQRALRAARILENESQSPTHLRAFAWHLVVETHQSVGWDLPADSNFASCRAAAASLSHSASLLIDEIAEQVHGIESPVLLLGALSASRSVFGRWDLLPANGALLVPLDLDAEGRPDGADLPEVHSLRWAAPGKLREVYEKNSSPAALNGSSVLVPHPELVAARSAYHRLHPEDPETLLFCGAAHTAAVQDSWSKVNSLARALGHRAAPLEFAVSLGIDRRLGLEISRIRRANLALRRLLRRPSAA